MRHKGRPSETPCQGIAKRDACFWRGGSLCIFVRGALAGSWRQAMRWRRESGHGWSAGARGRNGLEGSEVAPRINQSDLCEGVMRLRPRPSPREGDIMRNDDLGCGGWIPLLPVFLSFPCEGLLEAARGAVFVHFRPCWSYFSSVSSPSEQPLSSDGATT